MKIPEELLLKYNYPVPRYTSYPPANRFSELFSKEDYQRLIEDSNHGRPDNIAIYIHIPFCRKICHYCGCNTMPRGKGEMVAPYLKALEREIRLVTGMLDKNRRISQIHYGGGSPDILDPDTISRLNDIVLSQFSTVEKPEIAIECNPAYTDEVYISGLLRAGFNRFSFGVQDFDSRILKDLNRDPAGQELESLTQLIKEYDTSISINFDFIYGLPGQTVGSFSNTMARAAAIRPDRIVTFSYAHVPWLKKHQQILAKKGLPEAGEKMKMFLSAHDFLTGEGYRQIGLDHFVLPEDDLFRAFSDHELHRNFQGYCTRKTTGQVYAFGVTAISQLEMGYSQNTKDLNEYLMYTAEDRLPVERGYRLNMEEIMIREVITELMCNKYVNFNDLYKRNGLPEGSLDKLLEQARQKLSEMEADGLLVYSGDSIEVSDNGGFFIRNIASVFDHELNDRKQNYSRNV